MLGAKIVDLFPETRDMALAMHTRVRAGHRVEVPRHRQRLRERETWWEGSIVPVPMEGGTGLLITTREVSGRPARPAPDGSIADAAERLRILADDAPFAVFAKGEDGRYVFANRFVAQLLGRTPSELIGSTVSDILPRDVAARTLERERRASMSHVWTEDRVPTPTGERTFLTVRFPFAFGEEVGTCGIAFDVTDRKRIEQALRDALTKAAEVEERARSLARFPEENPDPVLRLDRELIVLYANDAARSRLRPFVVEAGVVAPAEIAGPARQAMQQRARVKAELTCGEAVFSLSVAPVGSEVNVYGQDITARKRAEQALREANRRKDDFLAMLSHELRNPLAPIRNSIYVLRRTEHGSEQAIRAQRVIERQTEHLTRLIDDLLDVTRIARGKIELRRSRVDICDIVSRAGDDFRLLMRERAVSFHVDVPDEQLWVDADPTRITQVIGNLLENASKFTRRDDEVTLSATASNGSVEIRVRDTGEGIAPALQPHIFEPFVQGERTLARTEGGLGLGLALVKGIAELHGGTVHVVSAGKGKGAEFVFSLPMLAAAPDQQQRRGPGRANAGRRVLVVDDNADAADSLAAIVTFLGHEVAVAYDGPTAVEKARSSPPDVVLCDIGMPGMSGYEVARVLRASAGSQMQLIAVSGYAQPEDVKSAIDAGFDCHVAKPADPTHIERLLSSRLHPG